MTRAALAEERRDEIDEWWEGGFLGAVPMASAHEERVRFAFHEDCRRAARGIRLVHRRSTAAHL